MRLAQSFRRTARRSPVSNVEWTARAPWSCADRARSAGTLSRVLGKQPLRCRCAPRVLDQLAKPRTCDCREAHEHRGIVAVMLFQKEHAWCGANQVVAH